MRKLLCMFLVFLCTVGSVLAQRVISGRVVDEKGNPVQFATIYEKGFKNATSADENGFFTLKISREGTLTITATGYFEKDVSTTTDLKNIVLIAGGKDLVEEVVVTASGLKMSKNKVGYGSTVLTSDKLVQSSPQNVTSALAGKVAGLQINAVDGGINPNYSIVLRGYRSITGNNQALIVMDNVIVPNAMLGNLNPNDIENITILNGAAAAALYGSLASNGALIITSKKGSYVKPEVTLSQNLTINNISFYPKVQKKYGSGSAAYLQQYLQYENQQYGDAYDGSTRPFGDIALPSGRTQNVVYAWNSKEGKLNFWHNSIGSQSDISVSMPTSKKGRMFLSGQYLVNNGALQGDQFTRAAFSIAGSERPYENLVVEYSVRYTQNSYNQAQPGIWSALYDQILNTPGQVPITRYKNWRTDSFAMPDFYYNAFYNNPYFIKDNNRNFTKNEYLVGNMSLKYSPLKWLDVTGRLGITSRNYNTKDWSNIYIFSDYAKANTHGNTKKTDITGSVADNMYTYQNLIGDFLVTFKKQTTDFDLQLTTAAQFQQIYTNGMTSSIAGLAVPDIFNISNQLTNPSASEAYTKTRTVGFYADFYGTWRQMVTLHLTGRRDVVSILDPGFNTFYYPAGDISLLLHKMIPAIAKSKVINTLKLRGAMSNVGNVNIGAYATQPTISQAGGYPYSGNVGFSVGNSIVRQGLKPEYTFSREVGFDIDMVDNRISASFTVYKNNTKNQTLNATLTPSTGYTQLLSNTGKTSGQGIEASLSVTPIRQANYYVTVGANYTYNNNKVDELGLGDLKRYQMLYYSDGTGVYASTGKPFPGLYATDYLRDSVSGKVIVDRITGYPTLDPNIKYAGNTQPKHRIGLNLEAGYKQFSLRAVGEYRGSYVMYNGMGSSLDFSGAGINTVMYDRQRFVFPNSVYLDPSSGKYVNNNTVEVADGGSGFWTSANNRRGVTMNYVTSGAFWKLREVAITYTASEKLLRKIGVFKGIQFSLVGRNLFIWTPKENVYTDPEFTSNVNGTGNSIGLNDLGQIPPSRYYGATLTVKF